MLPLKLKDLLAVSTVFIPICVTFVNIVLQKFANNDHPAG